MRLSSSAAPEPAALAIDGNVTTRWHSGQAQGGAEWVRVDFARRTRVTGLSLDASGFENDYPRRLEVSLSRDGRAFAPAMAVPRQSGPRMDVGLPSAVPVCSLKLEQKGSDPFFWWSISELAVYGEPAPGAKACPTPASSPSTRASRRERGSSSRYTRGSASERRSSPL